MSSMLLGLRTHEPHEHEGPERQRDQDPGPVPGDGIVSERGVFGGIGHEERVGGSGLEVVPEGRC